ncbi:MAG: STAS domain-containing protein [Cyanobacteriota bacterium]|nr:STAS domain-containing protein [Cyanobacteriota bacterium]
MYIVIRPQQDLDLTGANLLKQKLLNFVETPTTDQPSYWVIDLEQVNGIDHFGLFVLVELRRLARQKKCHLRLCNLKKQVRSIFEIAELDQKLKIWDKQLNETAIANYPLLLC